MPEFTGACIQFPFQGVHLFSHFSSVTMSHTFYFLSCRDTGLSLYFFLPLLLILFVSLQDPCTLRTSHCMSHWPHHLSPFPCVFSCSANPFRTVSACSVSRRPWHVVSSFTVVMSCLYSTCSSHSLLVRRGAQNPSSCLLASNSPLHVEASSWICFFQLQIFLRFFNPFISSSEHLLSHPKSQLRICRCQCLPLLLGSSCLIFSSLWRRHHSYVFRKLPQGPSLWLVARCGVASPVSTHGCFAPWRAGCPGLWSSCCRQLLCHCHCHTPPQARSVLLQTRCSLVQRLVAWPGKWVANGCIFLLELSLFCYFISWLLWPIFSIYKTRSSMKPLFLTVFANSSHSRINHNDREVQLQYIQ